jgi:hypothetical protein
MSKPMRRRWPDGKNRSRIKGKRATPRRRNAPRFDTAQWDEATMLLAARSRLMCERCGQSLNGRGERHHRQRRRDGGDRLANLLLICTTCHGEITDKPESETHARRLGYIVPALGIATPDTLPVLLWGDTWVLLDDDGTATACDAPR